VLKAAYRLSIQYPVPGLTIYRKPDNAQLDLLVQ
jgi:hypothetical protein